MTRWTIPKIEEYGFDLLSNDKGWCHFRGNGFDVFINLDFKNGNLFNFHSYKSNFKGNFKALLLTEDDMKDLLRIIQ